MWRSVDRGTIFIHQLLTQKVSLRFAVSTLYNQRAYGKISGWLSPLQYTWHTSTISIRLDLIVLGSVLTIPLFFSLFHWFRACINKQVWVFTGIHNQCSWSPMDYCVNAKSALTDNEIHSSADRFHLIILGGKFHVWFGTCKQTKHC